MCDGEMAEGVGEREGGEEEGVICDLFSGGGERLSFVALVNSRGVNTSTNMMSLTTELRRAGHNCFCEPEGQAPGQMTGVW